MYYLYFEKYQSNAEYYWTANSVVNAQADNSLITTAENMSTLIPNLPICTLMRVVTQSGVFHSIIISARNSAQVEVYDANRYGGYNKINLVTMDYATFAKTFPKIIYFSQGNVYNSSLTGTCYFPLQQEDSVATGPNNTTDFQLTVNQTTSATFSGTSRYESVNDYKVWLYGEQKTGNNSNITVMGENAYPTITGQSFNKSIKITNGFFQFINGKVEIATGSNTSTTRNLCWVMTYAGNSSVGQ